MKRVAEVTARLLASQAADRVSFARVARHSGISRAWLYQYVGKSRMDLAAFTIRHFGVLLGKLEGRAPVNDFEEWRRSQIDDFSEFLDIAVDVPYVVSVYFRNRNSRSPIGRVIRESEEKFLALSAEEIRRVFGLSVSESRAAAEFHLAAKMGLVHHWAGEAARSEDKKQKLLSYFEMMIGRFRCEMPRRAAVDN